MPNPRIQIVWACEPNFGSPENDQLAREIVEEWVEANYGQWRNGEEYSHDFGVAGQDGLARVQFEDNGGEIAQVVQCEPV